eukprot:2073724-Rhodomonas_salina.2
MAILAGLARHRRGLLPSQKPRVGPQGQARDCTWCGVCVCPRAPGPAVLRELEACAYGRMRGTDSAYGVLMRGTERAYGVLMCGTERAYGAPTCGTERAYGAPMCGTESAYGVLIHGTERAYDRARSVLGGRELRGDGGRGRD